VHPHPSAHALACARLGWPAAEVDLVSAVARAPEVVARLLQPRRRLVAYVTGDDGARPLARIVTQRGFGPSRCVLLEHLCAPAALAGLDAPDATFIGGGVTTPGLVARCWDALVAGGRLVANAVTLEGEQALLAARAAHGGELTRIEISHAEPLGAFTGWRAQR